MRRSPAAIIRSSPAGFPDERPPEGLAAFFRRGGALDPRRDWAPMLDLLYAAANNGTGRRAALAIPTFGKTGTSQDNRDALFVGFAGNLIVGVWVGRDDNSSLGKVSGGTVPARNLAKLHDFGAGRRRPARSAAADPFPRPPSDAKRDGVSKSPLPPEWSDATKQLRKLARDVGKLFDER